MEEKYKLLKFIDGGIELDVRFSIDENTVYLNQRQICELYNSSKTSVSEHIKKIIETDGLDETLTVRIFRTLAESGRCYKVKYYNLDIILAVGYRTKSNRINKFNNWVKEKLKELNNELKKKKPLNYANNYEIVKFESGNISLDVNVSPSEDTVWLTQNDMANLFDTTKQNISNHIINIFNDCELEKNSVVKKSFTTATDGKTYNVDYYNLDMVLSVGYRVNSKRGIEFRRWANKILKEYLIKGYSINDDRSLVTNENYINLINRVDSMDIRLKKVENNELYFKNEKLIVNGEVFDALSYLEELVSHANHKILIVDPYIDSKVLNILKYVKDNVIVKITTSSTKSKLTNNDIKIFMKQYNKKINKFIDDDFHDRYLFIDDLVFHLGSSINYLGRRIAQIDKLEDEGIISYLKNRVKYNNL